MAHYGYDYLNQLVEYVDVNGQVYNYVYNNGNIEYIKLNGEFIKIFAYGNMEWADKLLAVNCNELTYDEIGNPLLYYNNSLFSWENGRWLSTVTKGANSYSYTYDGNGIRTSKTVNGTLTEFIYADGVLLGQTTEDDILIFLYDESGNKFGFIYNGAYYYYHINPQGDVIGIYNSNGVKVVTYEYDPWGIITNITDTSGINIGTINPIRYRGYYYDNETGLYYVSSRYYDPEIGRWISPDNVVAGVGQSVQGYNLYTYCFNNPVNMDDPDGNWPKWVQKIGNTVKETVSKVVNTVKSVVNKVKQDVKNFNIKNTSEKKVLSSNYVSAYKGKVVIRTNLERSGSYGALFISRKASERSAPEDEVRHEYGHTKQLDQLGLVKYTMCIGVPSMFEWGSDSVYYRRPWEITADIYGGVQSRSYPEYEAAGFEYLENSKRWGPLVWLTID